MKLTKEDFLYKIKKMAEDSNIFLNDNQLEKMFLYKEMLIEWNEKINLTAITDDEEIISKHIIDCLQIVKYIREGQSVIDIGTGAGLPGIIIAIYFEGKVKVTLFDALNKRILFLQEVIKKLNINNCVAIHGRAEESAKENEFREKYDIVVSRAVAVLNVLLELTVPFVKVGGICMYMKADKTKEELKNSKNAIKELDVKYIETVEYDISLNQEKVGRTIIRFLKEKSAKEKYPRQFSRIKKNPL